MMAKRRGVVMILLMNPRGGTGVVLGKGGAERRRKKTRGRGRRKGLGGVTQPTALLSLFRIYMKLGKYL